METEDKVLNSSGELPQTLRSWEFGLSPSLPSMMVITKPEGLAN